MQGGRINIIDFKKLANFAKARLVAKADVIKADAIKADVIKVFA